MALMVGCAPIQTVQRNASPDIQEAQVSQMLMNQAADSYVAGSINYWDWFRTREGPAQEAKSIAHQPLNIDSNLKAKAMAGTLRDKLEIEPKVAINIAPLIEQSAETHQVPPALIAAVVNVESEFHSSKRSSSGAIGLTQVMPRVWGKQCNLKTDAGNIDCGAKILAHYYDLSGSWDKALAYYNVGPGKYEKSKGARMTGHRYASTVMASMKQIKAGREQLLLVSTQGD
jgi:soluble lytic murein transglycosylase-like protein